MLELTDEALTQEIDAALARMRKFTDASRDRRRQSVGPNLREDEPTQVDEHENHGAELAANLIPDLVYSNPIVEVDSDVSREDDPQIVALQAGLNWIIERNDLRRLLTKAGWGVLHDFAVLMCVLEPFDISSAPNETFEPPLWPRFRHLPNERFFFDSQAADYREARIIGHVWIRDLADLQNATDETGAPIFDADILATLNTDDGLEEFRKQGRAYKSQPSEDVDRREIVGFEVYVRESGKLYTLARSAPGSYVQIRKPRPYYGPKCGPYVVFGVMNSDDQPLPIAPLAITEGTVRELNAHAGQASSDAASAKRLIVLDGSNKTITEGITTYANNSVIVAPGWTGQMQVVEIPGAQPANLDHIARVRERLDRLSGLSQNIRGNITGATATEVNKTQQSADKRTRSQQQEFADCVIDLLTIAAWFIHESPAVRFPIAVSDPETGEKTPAILVGGPQPGMPHIPFEFLSFRITPYSMEFIDDAVAQKRMQTAVEIVTNVAPMALQFPFIKVRALIEDMFEALNIDHGADRYIDMQILQTMQGMMLAPPAPGQGLEAGQLAATSAAGGQPEGSAATTPDVYEQAAMLAESQTA